MKVNKHMIPIMPLWLSFYENEIIGKIQDKYNLTELQALKKFLNSQTYKMLADISLEMWDFPPAAIFNMWEAEIVTGKPQNSIYLRSS